VASRLFRAGVVLVVERDDGRVLAFERADNPGAWQLPQGGIDAGESVEQAAWRELSEETGLAAPDVALTRVHPQWTVYEWPADIAAERSRRKGADLIGQVHRWVFFHAEPGVEPTPDGHEFVAAKWVSPAWLVDHVAEFRRGPYREVLG
jgi:putative (di)nucleoside polyphosphate hydrolase